MKLNNIYFPSSSNHLSADRLSEDDKLESKTEKKNYNRKCIVGKADNEKNLFAVNDNIFILRWSNDMSNVDWLEAWNDRS